MAKKLTGFYNRDEVQELLGCGINKAQAAMKAVNDKLKQQGYTTLRCYVSKKAFNEAFNI